jgi:universal stress protein A
MQPIKIILAPTDFSESAARALRQAFELARALGAKVHILHVYGVPPLPDAAGMALGVDILGPLQQSAKQALAREVEAYARDPAFAEAALELGDARELILRSARCLPADLIVMGSHGRTGMQHFLLGSVAERTVRNAPCPVLVVPSSRPAPPDLTPAAAED